MTDPALARRAFLALASAVAAFPRAGLATGQAGRGSCQAAFEGFIDAFNRLDWAAFQSYFADEVSVFNPDVPGVPSLHRLDGRADVEAAFRGVFDASAPDGPHIVPERVQIHPFAEAALVTFEFQRPGQSYGRRTLVLHEERGRWRILHIHASNIPGRP